MRIHHCNVSLFLPARLACPARKADGDGRSVGRPGLAAEQSCAHRPPGPCEAALRSESAATAPTADRRSYRTTCECPAARLNPRPAVGWTVTVEQHRPAAYQARAPGPAAGHDLRRCREPKPGGRHEWCRCRHGIGPSPSGPAARRRLRRRGPSAASYRHGDSDCDSATFSRQCASSSSRSHSLSADV